MADRIFGIIFLTIAVGYAYVAFAIIEAPFQYDPLGPESWPQILAVCAILCGLYLLIRPDKISFEASGQTVLRIAIVVVLLVAYAYFFEILGFIVATAIFCAIFSRLFGATYKETILFGLASGVLGHVLCVILLDLNLPKGLLAPIL
ncbi:MAG: tripartite tricarboxylate transporter TctB family protein [Desulfuromonadales bacterium]